MDESNLISPVSNWESRKLAHVFRKKEEPKMEEMKPRMDNGWIKTEDLLPQENVGVMVFIPQEDEHITAGMWDVSKKWVLLDEYRVPVSEVTYWKPMNEKPDDRTYKHHTMTDSDDDLMPEIIRKLQKRVYELEHQSPPPDIEEESQDKLWQMIQDEMIEDFRWPKDLLELLQSKFHLTRVKAELKGEKK